MNQTAAFSDKVTRFVGVGKGVQVIHFSFRKVFDIVFCSKGGCFYLDGLNKQMAKKNGWMLRLRGQWLICCILVDCL